MFRLRNIILIFGLGLFASAAQALPPIPASGTAGGAVPQIEELKPPLAPAPEISAPKDKVEKLQKAKKQPQLPVKRIKIEGVIPSLQYQITQQHLDAIAKALLKTYSTKQGITLQDLWKIAHQLTLYYRQKGYILNRVFLPPQTIGEDRVVLFKVHNAKLGNVVIQKNKLYSRALLVKPFSPLLKQIVHVNQVEQAMLTLNDYPGLMVFAVFRPGKKSGHTEIQLQVKQAKPLNLGVGADNSGTSLTGRGHGFVNFAINNPFGAADQINVTAIRNVRPSNGVFGHLRYRRPFAVASPYSWSVGYQRNRFNLGETFATLDVSSISETVDLKFEKILKRDRLTKRTVSLDFARQHAITTQDGAKLNQDDLFVANLKLSGEHFYRQHGSIVNWNAKFSHGFNNLFGAMNDTAGSVAPSRTGAGGKFNRLRGDYLYQRRIFSNQYITLHARGQYSSDTLVSLQEFNLGGMTSVRGYPVSEFLMDKAILTTAEWRVPAPRKLSRWLAFSAFVDYGVGWKNNPAGTEEHHAALASYGAGLRVQAFKRLVFQLQLARPFGAARVPTDGRRTRYWFNAYYTII